MPGKGPKKSTVQLGETPLEINQRLSQGKASGGEKDWVVELQRQRGEGTPILRNRPEQAPSIDLGKGAGGQQVRDQGLLQTMKPEELQQKIQSGEVPMGMGAAYFKVQDQFKKNTKQQEPPPESMQVTDDLMPDTDITFDDVVQEALADEAIAASTNKEAEPTKKPLVADLEPELEEKKSSVLEEEDFERSIEDSFAATELTQTEKRLADTDLRKRVHAKMRFGYDLPDDIVDPITRAHGIYGNPERRELVRRRCPKLEIEGLLLEGKVNQIVPLDSGKKFNATFRTLYTGEDHFITGRVADTAPAGRLDYQQLVQKYELAFGLETINDRGFTNPTAIGSEGQHEIDEDKLKKKFSEIERISSILFMELYTHYQWFKLRVREELAGLDLGNG